MPKLLAEFLQEQQEPFALEVYLLERGYRKRLSLQSSADQYVAPDCSYFLRAVFNMAGGRKIVVSMAKSQRRPKMSNAGEDGFCSERSSTSLFNSSSESDANSHFSEAAAITRFVKCGNCFLERGVDADRDMKMRGEEDCKELSPVSVLEDSPSHYEECNLKRREESSNSTPRCRLRQPRRYRFERPGELDPYNQYLINKRALQQKKQLLIDCTQEVMENCRKLEDETKAVLGDGEIWEYICEKLWIWSQDSITQNNVVHLLHSELLASAHEWNAVFEKMKLDICVEIENDVLEYVINDIMAW